jgi:hypothetical protein
MRLRVPGEALGFVAQLTIIGAMVGSLYAPSSADQNAFVVGGAIAGTLIAVGTTRATTPRGLFFGSVIAGMVCGLLALAPLAWRTHDHVLWLSGASLGCFLSLPLYVLALPAFFGRKRAAQSRDGSILRRAHTTAVWAASGASIAVLGLLGQPKVWLSGRLADLSVGTLAVSAVVSLVVVVSDVRTRLALASLVREARKDVGLGDDTLEVRIPPSSPFRSAESVEVVRVGNLRAGQRALRVSIALDLASLSMCVAALVLRVRST